MEDFIKKIINTSLGAAILAKEKMSEFIDELVNKGKITEEEGEKFMENLRKETNKTKSSIEVEIKKIVEKMVERMDIATKEELKALEKRINKIEEDHYKL